MRQNELVATVCKVLASASDMRSVINTLQASSRRRLKSKLALRSGGFPSPIGQHNIVFALTTSSFSVETFTRPISSAFAIDISPAGGSTSSSCRLWQGKPNSGLQMRLRQCPCQSGTLLCHQSGQPSYLFLLRAI